jgi:hypothetical protein
VRSDKESTDNYPLSFFLRCHDLKYKFIILPVIIGLLLPSFLVPWVTINLFGYHPFYPLNILEELFTQPKSSSTTSQNQIALLEIATSYKDAYAGIIISIILFIISIPTAVTATVSKSRRSILLVLVAFLSISSSILWLYSIQSFKASFAHQASVTGGLIGEEWKGSENTLVNRIIRLGVGQYFILIAGIVALGSWVLEKANLYSNVPRGAAS